MRLVILLLIICHVEGYDLSWLLRNANVARSQSELIAQNKGEGSITLFSDNHAIANNSDALVDTFSKAKAESAVKRNQLNVQQELQNIDVEPKLAEDQLKAEKFLRIDKEYVCNDVEAAANLFVEKAETKVEATSEVFSTVFVRTKSGKVQGNTGGRAIAKARAILDVVVSLLAEAFNSHVAAQVQLSLELEINNVELAITDSLAHASALSQYHYGVGDFDTDDNENTVVSKAIVKILAKVFAAVFNCHEGIATGELVVNTTGFVKNRGEAVDQVVFLLKPPPPGPPLPPPAPVPSPPPPLFTRFVDEHPYLKDLDKNNQITYDDLPQQTQKDTEVQGVQKVKAPWAVRLLRGQKRRMRNKNKNKN